MPRVNTNKFGFEGESYTRVTNVDAKGKFSIKLLPQLAEALGYGLVEADTKAAVEKKWSDAHQAYTECKTTTRKVIAYAFEASGEFEDEDGEEHDFHEITFSEGFSVSAWAAVCIESATVRADHTRYKYEILESSLPEGMGPNNDLVGGYGKKARFTVDWTPEREAFFCMIGKAMMDLMLKLKSIEKPKALLERIDSGLLLEGPPAKKKTKKKGKKHG